MAQLRLRRDDIRTAGAEVLQITHSTVDEARVYFKHYPLAFPYLCDPERVVHERYGVPMDPGPSVERAVKSTAVAALDLALRGERTPSPIGPLRRYGGRGSPQATCLVDRAGVVRAVHPGGPFGGLPDAAALVRELTTLR